MRVYRIENPHTGEGPYRFVDADAYCTCGTEDYWIHDHDCDYEIRNDLQEAMSMKHGPKTHPACKDIKSHERVAMGSLEEIKEWFDGFFKSMMDIGFEVVEYYVRMDRTRRSGHDERQILFNVDDAIRLTPTTV
jgi:hypothetical protein